MVGFCYILYSDSLGRFYVGSTELLPKQRLDLHLSKFYGESKYTAKADDWQLVWSYECETISVVRKLEHFIKRMKSSTFIRKLIVAPAIVEDILQKI